jgi:hypothetical protein
MPDRAPASGIIKSQSTGNSVVTYAAAAAGFIQEIGKSANNVPFLNVVVGVSVLIMNTVEVRVLCFLILSAFEYPLNARKPPVCQKEQR